MLSFLFQVPPMHCMLHSATLGWQARYRRARRAVAHASRAGALILLYVCKYKPVGNQQHHFCGLQNTEINLKFPPTIRGWKNIGGSTLCKCNTYTFVYLNKEYELITTTLSTWMSEARIVKDYTCSILLILTSLFQSLLWMANSSNSWPKFISTKAPQKRFNHTDDLPCASICLVHNHIHFKQMKICYEHISFDKEVHILNA